MTLFPRLFCFFEAAGDSFSMRLFYERRWERMMVHLLFVTITIQRRKWTIEEIEHEQLVKKIEEEMMDRKCGIYPRF
jgi:uncharacterized protein (TIGR02413 family)